MNPKVTIIMATYNRAHFIVETLVTIQKQTFVDWECIIVNDGSPDTTATVAEKWIAKDNRFLYLWKENGGLSSARNFGIEHSKGEYILPLDADDKIGPNYVASAVQSFQDDPSLKAVYCQAEKFGDASGIWQLPTFSLLNLCDDNMIFCTS